MEQQEREIEIENEESSSESMFSEVKHYCLNLLDLLKTPTKHSHTLSQFHAFLLRSPSQSLQPFFE